MPLKPWYKVITPREDLRDGKPLDASEFGRGGDDGTPNRRTPWGEIAYQLGGAQLYEIVAEHAARP